MAKQKLRALYTGVLLCLAAAGLAGCGSGDDENAESAVTGRVTSISEAQIVIEAFEKPEGERPDASSGSGAGFGKNHGDSQNREKPQGTPPADGSKPDGTPPTDGGQGKDRKRGETKTYQIDSSTAVYKMSGEEKTEITLDDVELGSMVSIVTDGDKASSITVQDAQNFGGRRPENQGSPES